MTSDWKLPESLLRRRPCRRGVAARLSWRVMTGFLRRRLTRACFSQRQPDDLYDWDDEPGEAEAAVHGARRPKLRGSSRYVFCQLRTLTCLAAEVFCHVVFIQMGNWYGNTASVAERVEALALLGIPQRAVGRGFNPS